MPAPVPVPLEPRLFRMDPVQPDPGTEDAQGPDAWTPVLLGSRCPETRETYWPRRRLGATAMVPTEDVDLSPRGILYSWTYVHMPWFGQSQMDSVGYGVGQVDLPEGVRIQCVISGETGDWEIGMPMEIHHEIVEEREGTPVALFRFRPAEPATPQTSQERRDA